MFRISQWFGENPEYYNQFGLPGHEGLDLPLPNGNKVYAVKSGVVFVVSTNTGNYGIHVRIQHEDGYQTIYAHLQSTNVEVGQIVNTGDIIGLSNNTGNSSGSHLHFAEKQQNVVYTDENGIEWPFNFRDSWQHLKHLYQEWLDQNSIIGYLYAPSLVLNMQGDYARCTGTLNIRQSPNSTSQLLGKTTYGTVVKILSEPTNGYYQVQTPIDIPNTSQNSNPFVGLHLRADPNDAKSSEWIEVDRLKVLPRGIKLLHAHPQNNFRQAVQKLGVNAKYVIRIFQSWGDRNITPQQFYDWNKDELANRIGILKNEYAVNASNIWVEVHNEPNLNIEGLTYSWQNGTQFTQWANQTLALFKANSAFNGVKWVYPGLSPGGTIAGVRYDSTAFLTESVNVGLNGFDYIGCHAYWSQNYPMTSALDHIRNTQQIVNKPIVITEASINDRPAVLTPSQYGQQYAQFVNLLKLQSNVLGITFFVASASDNVFSSECWVNEGNQIKGIGQALVNSI